MHWYATHLSQATHVHTHLRRYSRASAKKLRLLPSQPNYPHIVNLEEDIHVDVLVWHATAGSGIIEDPGDIDDAFEFTVEFFNGKSPSPAHNTSP